MTLTVRDSDSFRLQACVRDLVALSSMRRCWIGRTPPMIAESLRDLLIGMLGVETVYVELRDRESRETHVVSTNGATADLRGENEAARFASYAIGVDGELGRFAVQSTRPDFPDRLERLLLRVAANEVAVALQHAALLLRHERAERLLAARAIQQATVAQLGLRAVTGIDADTMLDVAVTTIRDTLHVDFCDIFALEDDGALVMRNGDGWPAQLVGTFRYAAGTQFVPGHALATPDPVIVQDLRSDDRFVERSLLHEFGVVSSVSVVIHGKTAPFGVLGAHCCESRSFTRDDVHFQQSIANLLAATLERRRSEAERDELLGRAAKAQADAEGASRVKSEFLGMMSHELRTPLNAIGGYVELIDEGIRGPVTEEQKRDLARIRRSQRYLLGVIDNVLSFLKMGSGRVRYDLDDVSLEAVLAAVDEVIRPLVEARSIQYRREQPAMLLHVYADGDKLQQILLNLLSNAVKFTDEGGVVGVDALADGRSVRIDVRDSGRGIPADRVHSVFEPFIQIDNSRTRSAEGTGLGLTISRDFARGMGGDLSVASVYGRGSTFSVHLPRAAH